MIEGKFVLGSGARILIKFSLRLAYALLRNKAMLSANEAVMKL